MYIVYKLYYDFIGYSWSFSTNTGNITFRLYLIYLKKESTISFGGVNEVENYYTIPFNCNTLKIIFINSSDNI